MKMRSRFTVLGSLALLSSAPIAAADELAVEPSIVQCWVGPLEVFEEPIILICPDPYEIDPGVSIDPVIIDENGEGTFVEEETIAEEETFFEEETIAEEETFVEEETIAEEETFVEEETIAEEETFVEEETIAEEETSGEEVTFENEETSGEEVTDGEVVKVTDGGEVVYPGFVYDGEGFVIPLDWIKGGGGDHPQILYSMTNLGAPDVTPRTVLGPETSLGAEALTLNGTGVSNDGALPNISGSNTFGGHLTLGAPSPINWDAGTLTLSTTGTLTKNGAETLILTGANTFTGATSISAGTLTLGTIAGTTSVSSGAALELQGDISVGAETSIVTRQIGSDPKAKAVESAQKARVIQLNHQKNGPVALIKEGRVLLR
jgi:autotransporter-associated beta strand protein